MKIDMEPTVSANLRHLQNIRAGGGGNMTLLYSEMEKEREREMERQKKSGRLEGSVQQEQEEVETDKRMKWQYKERMDEATRREENVLRKKTRRQVQRIHAVVADIWPDDVALRTLGNVTLANS